MYEVKRHASVLLLTATLMSLPASAEESHPADPWEGFNRTMFSFNEGLDRAILNLSPKAIVSSCLISLKWACITSLKTLVM